MGSNKLCSSRVLLNPDMKDREESLFSPTKYKMLHPLKAEDNVSFTGVEGPIIPVYSKVQLQGKNDQFSLWK